MITFNTESRAFQINGTLPNEGKPSSSGKTTVLLVEGGAITPTLRYTLSIFEDKRSPAEKKAAREASAKKGGK